MLDTGLRLNNQYYSAPSLQALCHDKLQNPETPTWERHLYHFIRNWLEDTPLLQVNTSGATGKAKTITIGKQNMRCSARMTGRYFQLKAGQNSLLCLPVSHIAGQMMVVRAWELGLNLISCSPQRLNLKGMPEIAFAALVPQQLYHLLFEQDQGATQVACIKKLLLGGTTVSQPLLNMLPQLPCQIFQSYSMTETLSHIAIRRLSPPAQTFYQLLPGIGIETDRRNCLVIHAPHLGVKNVVTNDVVKLHGKHQFELLGRFDNLINSGGIKWHPEQLEVQLTKQGGKLFQQRNFFVGALPDNKLGQKLVLVIEGDNDVDHTDLQRQLKRIFKPYQRPKAIYFVTQFKRTPTAKVRRQIILDQLQDT